MTEKTVPELIKKAVEAEKTISELISAIQTAYDVTITEIKLDHTFAAKSSPQKTDVKLEIKLK